MNPAHRSTQSRYSFTLFKRPDKSGDVILYARIIDTETGKILAQRSTGMGDQRKAAAKAGQLLAELPLEAMSQDRETSASAELAKTERMCDLMLSRYFAQFWSDDSPYLAARDDAGKPLSRMYIRNQQSSVKRSHRSIRPFTARPSGRPRSLFWEVFVITFAPKAFWPTPAMPLSIHCDRQFRGQ